MFKHDTEFQAYLKHVREKCPEPPAMWEQVLHLNPATGNEDNTYCRGWFKAVSDQAVFERHFGVDSPFSRSMIADYQDRLDKRMVRVRFCKREEATHIELNGGGIVPLSRITRCYQLALVEPGRIMDDEQRFELFAEDAHFDRVLAYAS